MAQHASMQLSYRSTNPETKPELQNHRLIDYNADKEQAEAAKKPVLPSSGDCLPTHEEQDDDDNMMLEMHMIGGVLMMMLKKTMASIISIIVYHLQVLAW